MRKFCAVMACMICMLIACAPALAESKGSELNGLTVITGEDTVRITLSAEMIGDTTEAEISESAQAGGSYIGYELHEDGSVTYIMSAEKYGAMMHSLLESVDECIDMLLYGEQAVDSFVRIEYNESLSDITIYVDGKTFTTWDSMNALSFYIYGAYYQTFLGVPGDQIDIVISFIDDESGEVLGTASYRDYAK